MNREVDQGWRGGVARGRFCYCATFDLRTYRYHPFVRSDTDCCASSVGPNAAALYRCSFPLARRVVNVFEEIVNKTVLYYANTYLRIRGEFSYF